MEVKMNDFDKFFDEDSADGICAIIYCSANDDLAEQSGENYFCMHLYDTWQDRMAYWLCVRKSAVPAKGKVTLKVHEHLVAKVIGTGGKNIKKVAQALGGRYVTVQSV